MSMYFVHAPKASMEVNAFEIVDYIGMESHVDLRTDFDDVFGGDSGGGKRDRRRRVKREKEEKKYPPPIPCLARAELSVLKRYYTNDGSLVIKQEKAMNRKYLRFITADGRLQLFPFNDGGLDSREIIEMCEEKEETPIGDNVDPRSDNEDDDRYGGGEDRDLGSEIIPAVATGGGSGGGGRMCYKYNSLESSASCMLAMPMPAIRQVHI